jgi:DNA processing protein
LTITTETAFWLALLRAPGIGPARFALLLDHFGSPDAAFSASRCELAALGLPSRSLDYLAAPDWAPVEKDLAWLRRPNNHLIRLADAGYPNLLRQIEYPPPVLFLHGDPSVLGTHQIAIVGSRNPTPGGRETARDFATHLASAGIVISSGLALGIDAEAHRGALTASGQTVAIMGTGPDQIYPARHKELAHKIAEQGALVSEFPPGTPPLAENFPRRNRTISGLALGVLVVEAAVRSGSLITARQAVEQGREVFAIPGSIHNALSRGCHALIREGAKLVETATDILEELGALACTATETNPSPSPLLGSTGESHAPRPDLDEEYQRLLHCLGHEPVCIDLLVDRCGLTAEAISSMLLILELKGYVTAMAGGLYSRPRSERS